MDYAANSAFKVRDSGTNIIRVEMFIQTVTLHDDDLHVEIKEEHVDKEEINKVRRTKSRQPQCQRR